MGWKEENYKKPVIPLVDGQKVKESGEGQRNS